MENETQPNSTGGSEACAPALPASARLLPRLRAAVRARHYSLRTEQAYVGWVRRFVHFHGLRHPREMGATEVAAFLTHLASERNVSASAQGQAKTAVPRGQHEGGVARCGLVAGHLASQRVCDEPPTRVHENRRQACSAGLFIPPLHRLDGRVGRPALGWCFLARKSKAQRWRGSSASRRPSPSRLKPSTSTKIDSPGQIAIQGALST